MRHDAFARDDEYCDISSILALLFFITKLLSDNLIRAVAYYLLMKEVKKIILD